MNTKKAFKPSCILFIFSFFFFACNYSRQVKKPSPFNFVESTLSKGIETTGNMGKPIDITNKFSTRDQEVISLVKVKNISETHNLRWEWFDPDGNLYYSTDNFPIETSNEMYLAEATVWHRLSIHGDKAEEYPGRWIVKVFFDDNLMTSSYFDLKDLRDLNLPPHPLKEPDPNDWGFIIGIEDYASLPSVNFARKDALIVKDYFVKILGVDERNIITLIDKDATKADIEKIIRGYFTKNVNKNTTLYVYFAGHGAPYMKEESPEMLKPEPFLVPYNGDPRFIADTGYKLETFYQDLNNLEVERVYVFLDCCFSGRASRSTEVLRDDVRPVLVQVSIKSNEIITISAATSVQFSNVYPEKEQGLFTYFLLRALKGEANEDDDQFVSIKELFNYVKKNVVEVSCRMGSEQTPIITPSLVNLKDIPPICRVLRK